MNRREFTKKPLLASFAFALPPNSVSMPRRSEATVPFKLSVMLWTVNSNSRSSSGWKSCRAGLRWRELVDEF